MRRELKVCPQAQSTSAQQGTVERLLRALDNERSKGFSNSMGRMQHFDTFLVRITAPAGTSARTRVLQRAQGERGGCPAPRPHKQRHRRLQLTWPGTPGSSTLYVRCLQLSRAPRPPRRAARLHGGQMPTSAVGGAQHAELQYVRAQAAGYHRRDLDALQDEGRRYAALRPPERRAFVARLASVLAGLQWCGAFARSGPAAAAAHPRRGLLSRGRRRAHVTTSDEDRLASCQCVPSSCQGI